jgi:PTS system nitrogen regulatory IIA component
MNRLSKLLPLANIVVDCDANDKSSALDVVAELFAGACSIPGDRIRASLAAREAMGSTGLGQGVAIPHGRIRGIKQAIGAVVRLARPVDFGAPDGRPVALLVALLVPEKARQEHLEILSELAQMLSDRDLRMGPMSESTPAGLLARVLHWAPIHPAA